MSELKPCLHCETEGVIKERDERVGYNEYQDTYHYCFVECANCGCRSKEFRIKPLIETTDYTVADFRQNPVLRAKVEDEYDDYVQQVKQAAMDSWNTRPDLKVELVEAIESIAVKTNSAMGIGVEPVPYIEKRKVLEAINTIMGDIE